MINKALFEGNISKSNISKLLTALASVNVEVDLPREQFPSYDAKGSIFDIVARLIEFRDSLTGGHLFRSQKNIKIFVEKLIETGVYKEEISTWDISNVVMSSQLHDVGKLAIDEAILNKPAKLTPQEYNIIKAHTLLGVQILEIIEKQTQKPGAMHHAKIFAGAHHERWDGNGYPFGLRGENIPLEGRIMAIIDVYDALLSERPYKRPFPAQEAEQIILNESGTFFDPTLVEVFCTLSKDFLNLA